MGQNRVGRVAVVRAVYRTAAGNGNLMSVFRAAFRNQQVVPAILLIEVWAFRVASARTVPDAFGFTELFAGFRVDLTQEDACIGIAD